MASLAEASVDPALGVGWESEPHPWRRYGARSIDLILFGNGFTFLFAIVAGLAAFWIWPPLFFWLIEPPKWADFVIFMPLAVMLTGLGNAFCHARWGSTPGKWIFRLRVQHRDRRRLSLREALIREAELCWWGFGLGIVLLSFFMLIRSHGELENDGESRWDRRVGGQSLARVIEGRANAWLVVGVAIVIAGKAAGFITMLIAS